MEKPDIFRAMDRSEEELLIIFSLLLITLDNTCDQGTCQLVTSPVQPQSAPLVGGRHFSNIYQQTTHSVLPSWCLPLSSLQVCGKIREKGIIK